MEAAGVWSDGLDVMDILETEFSIIDAVVEVLLIAKWFLMVCKVKQDRK